MSAYAKRQRERSARLLQIGTNRPQAELAAGGSAPMLGEQAAASSRLSDPGGGDGSMIDLLIDRLVARVAAAVVARLENDSADRGDEWFDSAQPAEYLGLHRDTLRRLAAAREIPAEQDGRGCKLFFRRSALDEWRQSGGRVRHLAALADAA
jgi:excisionase family DNA binding protein